MISMKSKIVAGIALVVASGVGTFTIDGGFTSIQIVGATAPSVSPSDRATLYYNTTTDTVQVSQNGAAYASIVTGAVTGATGTLLRAPVVVTTPGTTTYTTGTGTTLLTVKLCGAGGGGGSASNGATDTDAAGGGGAGSCAMKTFNVTASTGYTIALGVAGAGGTAGGNGSAGGSTTFSDGATVTAPGGSGGGGTTACGFAAAGAGGAIATNGDRNGSGEPGGWGYCTSATTRASGAGGSGPYGGGGKPLVNIVGSTNGAAGTGFGSGGGGSIGVSNGGAGTGGIIIGYEYLAPIPTVPVAGATLWLDADDAATLTGDPVSGWSNKGSAGAAGDYSQGTGSFQPVRVPAGQNGKNTILFDGIDNRLNGPFASTFIVNNAFTIFIVARAVAITSNDQTNWNTNDSFIASYYTGMVLTNSAGTMTARVFNIDGTPAGGDAASVGLPGNDLTQYNLFTSDHASGNIHMSVNAGAESTTASGNTSALNNRYQLGMNQQQTIYSNVAIAEILIYSTALSAGDKAANQAYLKAKWATP